MNFWELIVIHDSWWLHLRPDCLHTSYGKKNIYIFVDKTKACLANIVLGESLGQFYGSIIQLYLRKMFLSKTFSKTSFQ